ncbi:MAG TPA: asparagine synthase (glutamine-hydrolyzing) [Tepidisphaeraceae bacterium]|jgi:asparagine synthase (glutamine-hydrolysing)
MCGIAGIIAEKELVVREALAGMVSACRHRGPDDEGIAILPFGQRVVGLGQRRLSIQDLSAAGHQPMVHPQTRDQLIFNGELYNYPALRRELEAVGETFIGHSDTEALLYGLTRWGADYLNRLEGMFAFAFYDAKQQRLMLARDHVGIKPLYVARIDGRILFGSEVRSVLASGLVNRELDSRGVAGLLAYGAVQHPCTIFKNISSFPAGSFQYFQAANGQEKPKQFWTFPGLRDDVTIGQAIERARTTLEYSVRDHLISDVPVGVFLSSGIDSTVVAALASKYTTGLRSFSVGFADQPDLSELTLAKETAQILELPHTEILVNGGDCERTAVEWLSSLDLPSVDGLNVYIISKMVRAEGIKVALSGQGGDELFGGYPSSFYDVPRLQRIMRRMRWLPSSAKQALATVATVGSSSAVRQKLRDMMKLDGSVSELYLQRRRAMSNGQLAELGLEHSALGLDESFVPAEALENLPGEASDPVWAISQLESRFYQHNMLLRDADANGMAHGLEIRVPILDRRMLDLMLPLPGSVRLPNGIANKHILRQAMLPYLRPALLNQSKRGFTLPIRRWMVGPLRELCEEALRSLKRVGALRQSGIDGIWKSFLAAPESPMWTRAFTLVVLGRYLQQTKTA